MSAALYTELGWLPPPPDDFAAACKALAAEAEPGSRIRALANHALNESQLSRLGRVIARLRTEGRSLAPLEPYRLGLIGNGTLDMLVPILVGTAARTVSLWSASRPIME